VFGLSPPEAERVTAHAHFNGLAYVMTLPIEEAKHRVGQAYGIARQAGFPLTFTVELEGQ
jgi:ATP-dependent Clp protease adapter protein ClpS